MFLFFKKNVLVIIWRRTIVGLSPEGCRQKYEKVEAFFFFFSLLTFGWNECKRMTWEVMDGWMRGWEKDSGKPWGKAAVHRDAPRWCQVELSLSLSRLATLSFFLSFMFVTYVEPEVFRLACIDTYTYKCIPYLKTIQFRHCVLLSARHIYNINTTGGYICIRQFKVYCPCASAPVLVRHQSTRELRNLGVWIMILFSCSSSGDWLDIPTCYGSLQTTTYCQKTQF